MNVQAFLNHFSTLDRSKFVPEDVQAHAQLDHPLPIGFGQTISQPSLVRDMSLLLNPDYDHIVLEIGTGSGYQTALLAPFCTALYTIEIIPELSTQAQQRLQHLGFSNIHFHIGDGSLGWPEFAPFDRIIVTAGCSEIPPALVDQLARGGRLLIPLGERYLQRLIRLEKDHNGNLSLHDEGGVVFVELVGTYGWTKTS